MSPTRYARPALALAASLALGALLSGCAVAGATIGAVGTVAGAAVSATGTVAGAAIDAVTPNGESDKE